MLYQNTVGWKILQGSSLENTSCQVGLYAAVKVGPCLKYHAEVVASHQRVTVLVTEWTGGCQQSSHCTSRLGTAETRKPSPRPKEYGRQESPRED